ncbi:unnamed protein product [Amoebophrya sp. A25]|nr:unnamed protein product [Amoebophrya sp. A25]|eukprot:GSA25T00008875001.1
MEHDPLIVKGNRLLFDRRKKEKEAGGDGAGAVRLDDLFQFLVPLIHYLVGLISCAYYLVWLSSHNYFYSFRKQARGRAGPLDGSYENRQFRDYMNEDHEHEDDTLAAL